MEWLTLSNAADVLSVVGFSVSVTTLLQVRSIAKRYLTKARAPQLRHRLEKCCSKINEALIIKDLTSAFYELRMAEVVIQSLSDKMSGDALKRCKHTLNVIRTKKGAYSEADVSNIYVELLCLVSAVDEALEDLKWKGE